MGLNFLSRLRIATTVLAMALGCTTLLIPYARAEAAGQITVFAAASLKNAMDELAQKWQAETGNRLVVSLAGSSALARQIEAGAPADVFISANTGWMDRLEKDNLILPESRFDLLHNSLVLIASGKDAAKVEIGKGFDLAHRLGDGRLAMALVDAVPAGMYGKAALKSLGIWDKIAPKVAQVDNVRAALALVATGETPYGIVYATDAVADPRVTAVATFPADSHPPITYPVAIIRDSQNPLDKTFLQFLTSDAARAAFERQGFVMAK